MNELLNNVAEVISQDDNAEVRGEAFNLFKLCGINHYEIWHSKILAEFLNPKGTHGYGTKFLKHFFDVIGVNPNESELEKFTVTTEEKFDNGRMDVTLKSPKDYFVIENKIYAGDQELQVRRYSDFLNKVPQKNTKLFYLTLDGHSPSVWSTGDDESSVCEFSILSYEKNVCEWLDKCLADEEICADIIVVLKHYKKLIKDLCNSRKDEIMKQVMDKITSSADSLRSAKAISDTFNSAVIEMMRNVVEDVVKELQAEGKLCMHFEQPTAYGGLNNMSIGLLASGKDYWLNFELNNYTLHFGIWLKNASPVAEIKLPEIPGIENHDTNYFRWSYLTFGEFDPEFRDWSIDNIIKWKEEDFMSLKEALRNCIENFSAYMKANESVLDKLSAAAKHVSEA